ncbi:S-layer homology domain-containing protein [Paenibacillus sp. FJAT-26967]|uniref:S-layer homology domain-containing protein n=1 Tax=Paenibacillus sp. FJAT-26967 TaxID=1729690 RepID=UPI000839884C|nr:S-layer homology domain-containing protein [Paenibacillus sp. FJAT-26967]
MSQKVVRQAGLLLLSFCLFLSSWGMSTPARAAADVLVPVSALENAGFEMPVSANVIPGWTQNLGTGKTGTVEISNSITHSGAGSLKVTDGDNTASFGLESGKMKVLPGQTYRAAAKGYIGGGAVNIQLRFYDSADKLLAAGGIVEAGGSVYKEGPLNEWQTLSVQTPAPAGAAKASLVLVTGKTKKGTVYWDDAAFTRVMPLTNSGFEEPAAGGAVPGWTQNLGGGKSGGLSVSGEKFAAGSSSLRITDNDTVNFGAESSRSSVTPLASYTVTSDVYVESGSVQLQLRFFGADGTLIASQDGGIAVHDPNFTSAPAGQWQRLSLKAAAPAQAASAAVALVSGKDSLGTSYWDEVSLEEEAFVMAPKQDQGGLPGGPAQSLFLANGGFEQPASGTSIPGWTVKSGNASLSQTNAFEGKNSLFIQNEANTGPAVNVESDLIDVEEGASYSLTSSVFLQAGNLEGMYVYVYDAKGTLIPGPTGSSFHAYVNLLSASADGKWGLAEGTFNVQPGGKKAKVSLITGTKKSFQVYLDDISLLKAVVNGGFEQEVTGGSIPGWRKVNEAADAGSFGVTGEKFAAGAKSLKIQNTPDRFLNVISELIPVEAGATYTAKAQTFIDYGTADMYVRYFDASGKYLNKQNFSIKSEPASTWFTNYVEAAVPAEASYAAVMFAGSSKKTYSYYVDDVKLIKGNHVVHEVPAPDNALSKVAQDLGVQVRKANIMRGDIGKYGDGRDVMYTVVQGSPSVFTVIDIQTEKVITSKPLPDTEGAWSVKVSSDGTVYLGAYNKGLLYRYDPVSEKLSNLGHPLASKDAVLYPMDSGPDGKMYGGTYPTGSVYQYDPATGIFTDYGTMASKTDGERWTRVTVYDADTDKIYAGVGNQARLVEYDIKTGTKRDLLPEKYRNIISVYDLNLVDGKLFARKEANNSFETFVLDAKTGQEILITDGDTGTQSYELINYSRGVSPKSPIANKMYYAGANGILFEYDLSTNTYRSLGVSIGGAAIGYTFVQLKEEGFPGYSLVGLSGNGGKMYKYNLETGKVQLSDLMLPAEAVKIHDIEKGPDGKIYTTGYLAGNVGVHTPTTGSSMYLNGMGQSESVTVIGDSMYFGLYPDAKIYEYNLKKPWNRDETDKLNPNLLFSLSKNTQIPGYTLQDRPFGIAGAEDLNKLFVGTVPKNGLLGGALAVYDLTERTEPEVYWNLVPDQSLITLAYKDGIVYGGTSIHGGQGGAPKAAEAVLFGWDVLKKEKVFEVVPVAGKQAITALHIGPDGNIWGLANGALFIFDPEQQKVTYSKNEFPGAVGRWIDGSMVTGTDGHVYATVGGNFFKVDAGTKEVTVLASQAQKVAQDDFGHFYLYSADGINLYKYTIPELVLKLTGAELSVPKTTLRTGEEQPVTLKGLLEKNRSTAEMAGASVSYTVSDTELAVIDQGVVKAMKPGRVDIRATVALGGNTVQSNVIQLVIEGSGSGTGPSEPNNPGGPGSPGGGGSPSLPGEEQPEDGVIVEAPVKSQGGTAEYEVKEESYSKAAARASASGMDTLLIRLKDAAEEGKITLQLPSSTVDVAVKQGISKLTIGTGFADVTLRVDALQEYTGAALSMEFAKTDAGSLDPVTAGQAGGRPVYHVKLYADGSSITSFKDRKAVEISMNYRLHESEDPSKLAAYLLDEDGQLRVVKHFSYDAEKKRVTLVTGEFSSFIIKQAEVNFTDVSEERWSSSYVNRLAVRGIITGRTDALFSPEENVTRAEFLKLMMEAFDLIDEQSDADFTDVHEKDWYYRTVASAKKHGIVSGISDSEFGPGQKITREDMAVIAHRTLQAAGIELPEKNGSSPFEDQDATSSYAREAVEDLYHGGVISGIEDRRFAPQETATREQAAKITWLLFELQ